VRGAAELASIAAALARVSGDRFGPIVLQKSFCTGAQKF
jgi:hypothetical protein